MATSFVRPIIAQLLASNKASSLVSNAPHGTRVDGPRPTSSFACSLRRKRGPRRPATSEPAVTAARGSVDRHGPFALPAHRRERDTPAATHRRVPRRQTPRFSWA